MLSLCQSAGVTFTIAERNGKCMLSACFRCRRLRRRRRRWCRGRSMQLLATSIYLPACIVCFTSRSTPLFLHNIWRQIFALVKLKTQTIEMESINNNDVKQAKTMMQMMNTMLGQRREHLSFARIRIGERFEKAHATASNNMKRWRNERRMNETMDERKRKKPTTRPTPTKQKEQNKTKIDLNPFGSIAGACSAMSATYQFESIQSSGKSMGKALCGSNTFGNSRDAFRLTASLIWWRRVAKIQNGMFILIFAPASTLPFSRTHAQLFSAFVHFWRSYHWHHI